MSKMIKVTFLLDKNNDWFHEHIKNYNFKFKKKYSFSFRENYRKIKNQDVVIILGFGKILPKNFLNKNKLNLVVHESKLPLDKGGAPVQYQVLRNKKKIYTSIIEAISKLDSGNIYIRTFFKLNGTELMDEIRKKQAFARLNIIKTFLRKFPNIKSKKQKGRSTYNKIRAPKDSQLNINKSIKSQFNLLRICDNDRYPAFFVHKKKKFLIKIFIDKNYL